MIINDFSEIEVGLVLFFVTSKAVPPVGHLDAYALAKKHPYLCTARCASGSSSQWLFLTSDQYRGDAGRVFAQGDKQGHPSWTGKDSYFKNHNHVLLRDWDVKELAKDDISHGENRINVDALTQFGLDVFDPFVGLPKPMSATAAVFTPAN